MAIRGYVPYNPREKTMVVLWRVQDILREYADDLPLTLRQIFYRLVALDVIDKTENAYDSLGGYLRRARRASLLEDRGNTPYIPFSALRDDSTSTSTPLFYAGRGEFMRSTLDRAKSFKLDRQKGQKQIIEIWCEAAGLIPTLFQLAAPYSISVYSSGGVDGITPKHNLALRVRDRAKQGVMTRILHVGDFDPTGEMMYRVLSEDVATMAYQLTGSADWYRVERVALTDVQIIDRNVITAPPKPLDSNLRRFIADNQWLVDQLGTTEIAAQLEALTPAELRELLDQTISRYVDSDIYDDVLGRERKISTALTTKLTPANPITRKAWGME